MEKNYFILKNNKKITLEIVNRMRINSKWFCFLFFIFQMSYGQSNCNLVKGGGFNNNTDASRWSFQPGETGWYRYGTEAHIYVNEIDPISLKQNVTGLLAGSLTVSFKIKGQNADRLNCNTSATLLVKIGGDVYMTIQNPTYNPIVNGDAVINTSDITTPISGTTYVQSGFPLVVGRDSSTKPGIPESSLTQGTITITIPSWTKGATADIEFVASSSENPSDSGNCTATFGGDDWFLDDISVVANPIVYDITGNDSCSGTATNISLNGSQLGVNYQLQLNNVNVGTAKPGTGSAISFGSQSVVGVYTILATPVATSCTTAMGKMVTIYPNPTLTVVSATAVCSGFATTVSLTGLLPNTTSRISYTIDGVAQTDVTGVISNALGAATFTSVVLTTAAHNGKVLRITRVTNTSNIQNCSSTFNVAATSLLVVRSAPTLTKVEATTVCAGSGTVVTLTGLLASTTSTISYSIDGVAQPSVASVTSNPSGTATFTTSALTAANNGKILQVTGVTTTSTTPNCSASFTQNVALSVNPILTASVSISATATTICQGALVTFTAAPTNSGTNPTYQWRLNGVNVGTNSSTYTSTTLANGSIITCVMTSNATPCLTGSPATSSPITMTVSTALTAVSISPTTAQPFCPSGTGKVLTASGTGGGVLTYQWGYRTVTNGAITPIAGKTANTYTPTFADLESGTKYIVCTVTPGCGAARITNEVTVTITGPAATGVTICAGPEEPKFLTSSASCTAIPGTQTASGFGGTSNSDDYGGNGNTDISINFPALPAGAVVSSILTTISYTSYLFSGRDELRIRAIPPTALGQMQDNLKPSNSGSSGTVTNVAFGTWGTASPVGTWVFKFRETNNNISVNPDADISNISIIVTYTVPGSIDWYTTATLGTKVSSGASFNPVNNANVIAQGGIYSSLANTNTPGTYPFYVECSSNPGCRTPVNYVINAKPAAPTATALVQPNCSVLTGSITLNNLPIGEWTIKQTGSVEATYNNTVANTTSYTIPILTAGTYSFTVASVGNCDSEALLNVVINNPPALVTWNGTNWSPGAPGTTGTSNTTTTRVEFTGGIYNSTTNIDACSCYVKNNAVVTFNSEHTLNVINEVIVESGSLTFENGASLVQHNEGPNINSGNIIYKRKTKPVNRLDYTYWSSPVTNMTLGLLSPKTFIDKYFSYINVTVWKLESRATAMDKGIGYSVRAPQTILLNAPAEVYEATFTGVPHNGLFSTPSLAKNQAHLLGNPYPSAIDADVFLDENSKLSVLPEQRVLEGTLYFWTHNSPPSTATPGDKKYNYTANDYATYNRTGGVSTAAKVDPLNYATGTNFSVPTGNIAAGQGFFAPTKAGGTVVFNNTMRISGGASGTDNSQFFKLSANSKTTSTVAKTEKNRIWLNLTNSEGAFKQTLVGYITGATNDYDGAFDGVTYDGNQYVDFYSVNNEMNLSIQGRALPFVKKDSVALGYKSTIKSDFQISIDNTDGALSSQNVFLEDKVLKVQHDLKKEAYTFNTEIGVFNNRFVLRYVDKNAIEIIEPEIPVDSNTAVLVSVQNEEITVNSPVALIDKVVVYDVAGRKRYQNMKVANNSLIIKNILSSHQVLVVKITLENGKTVTNKIVY